MSRKPSRKSLTPRRIPPGSGDQSSSDSDSDSLGELMRKMDAEQGHSSPQRKVDKSKKKKTKKDTEPVASSPAKKRYIMLI